jgi:hypothetical protein
VRSTGVVGQELWKRAQVSLQWLSHSSKRHKGGLSSGILSEGVILFLYCVLALIYSHHIDAEKI